MCDFEVGDVVKAISYREAGVEVKPYHVVHEANRGMVGQLYTVTSVAGPYQDGMMLITLRERAHSAPAKGFDGRCFRRVYRPDGSFLRQCLEPVKEGA